MTSYSYCNISDAFDEPLHDEKNAYQYVNDAINDPFYNDFSYGNLKIDNAFISATGKQYPSNLVPHSRHTQHINNMNHQISNTGTSIDELKQQKMITPNIQNQHIVKQSTQKEKKNNMSENKKNLNNSGDIFKLLIKMQEQINKQSQIISNLSNVQMSNQIAQQNSQLNQTNLQNGIFNLDPKTKDLLLIFLIAFLLIFVIMMIFKK